MPSRERKPEDRENAPASPPRGAWTVSAMARNDAEHQLVLRLPDSLTEIVRGAARESGLGGPEINMYYLGGRTYKVHIEAGRYSEAHLATVKDLPTRVESYKTLDDKRLFKSCDIFQVLVVDPHPINGHTTVNSASSEKLPDGLAPPTRKIDKRFFESRRRQLRQRDEDFDRKTVQETEKALCEVLAARNGASARNKTPTPTPHERRKTSPLRTIGNSPYE